MLLVGLRPARPPASGRTDAVFQRLMKYSKSPGRSSSSGTLISRRRAAGHALLVAAVVDGELRGIAQPRERAAAECARRASETWRSPACSLQLLAQQRRGPLLHFAGRLVGERDGQNPRRRRAVLDQLGDAIRDHARLARAAPASTNSGPASVSTASRWAGFSDTSSSRDSIGLAVHQALKRGQAPRGHDSSPGNRRAARSQSPFSTTC